MEFNEDNQSVQRLTPDKIARIVNLNIQSILKNGSFSPNIPLMNLGMSSLELLELRDLLSKAFNEPLHATFFFQYTTANAITDYFINKIVNIYRDWLYNLEWAEVSIPLLPATGSKKPGIWLIFLDEEGWGVELISKMKEYGFSIVSVKMGAYFKALSPNEFMIRPQELSDYQELLKENCFASGINGVIYLWGLFAPIPDDPSFSLLISLHALSCSGLLNIVKSLTQLKNILLPKLYVASWSLKEEGDAMSLAQWPMTGLCKAIGTEHPDFKLRQISSDRRESDKLTVDYFFAELFVDDQEDQITWREGKRLAPRLIRVELPEMNTPQFQENATYIITGGLGGLGLEFLKWYVERGAKNLVILDHEEKLPEADKILQKFISEGIRIRVYEKSELANSEWMKKTIDEINSTLPPIKGIMHVASIIDDDLLINLNWNRFSRIYDLKIGGAWFLHQLTQKMSLDHFILFSSIGSAMGPPWRANRVSANAFLDALSHYRHALGLPVLTINWGPWSQEGISVTRIFETRVPPGMVLLKAEEGMCVLDRILGLPIPEVVVAPVDWREYLHHQSLERPLFAYMATEAGLKKSEIIRRFRHAREEERFDILKSYIRTLMRRILFLRPTAKLDGEKPFSELGLDERSLIELRNLMQYDLGSEITLPYDILVTNPSIEKLSVALSSLFQKASPLKAEAEEKSNEPIAVIGMACRFPGARNYQEFWENLVNKVDSIVEIPPDRWDWRNVKTKVKWGGFIKDIDKFDPLFFNISPAEAAYIDPQHRIFLQTAWHAMEDAGYSSRMLAGKKIGVYAGVSKNDYAELMRERGVEIMPYISTGTVHSILSNRVSYTLDIHGPSQSIDTACSSALVAMHSAIQDIRSGNCEMAFVGGVNALLSPTMYISHTRSGMLSEDGHCKTFDASANGYVRGEGVGVVLLKPLSEALKDGDFIHAVIRSIAINHGGKSTGLTAPNINSQAAVVRSALEESRIDPETISFIEVHGTGTPLGDPVEIEGLKKAFFEVTKKKSTEKYCILGAVKTNIGHCESAAGIAGVIKMILAMENRAIPANLHFKSLNPKINLDDSPFTLATSYQDWNAVLRRGGVSCFGMGGANAHVIMEEAPQQKREIKSSYEMQAFPLSAKKGRLKIEAENLRNYLVDKKQIDLESLAYTLQTGRDVFEEKVVFMANTLETLVEKLGQFIEGKIGSDTVDELALQWTQKPQRMGGLPGYPFQEVRCWFEEKGSHIRIASSQFYLKDHIVAGRSIMPGVMYLEMAREAAGKDTSITNVHWISPLEVTGDFIDVTILVEDSHFKIFEKGVLKCSGNYEKLLEKPERIDIGKILQKCPHKKSHSEIYEKMKVLGLSQGPSLRVINEFHSCLTEALGELKLNPSEKLSDFVLHPSLMDGVFQTVVAHHFSEHSMQQYLPYALDSVQWFRPLENEVYAYVEELPESTEGLLKYRMKMLTLEGDVIVQFEGFARRPLVKESVPEDIYYIDHWEEKEAKEDRKLSENLLLFSNEAIAFPGSKVIRVSMGSHFEKHGADHYVLNPGSFSDFQTLMKDLSVVDTIVYAWDIFDLTPILFLTQTLMQSRNYQNCLLLYVYTSPSAQYAMVAGFGRTLHFENPKIELRSLEMDSFNPEIIAKELKTLDGGPLLEVSYVSGVRRVRKVIPAGAIQTSRNIFKSGGTYLITGGTGGLGQIFAKYLADNYQANLILVGRKELNKSIQQVIDDLKTTAKSVHYLAVDVTDENALQEAFRTLPKMNLNGVIHAAGLKNDSFILKKDATSFNEVIDTKVKGALSLDALTKNMDLDFMVFFSSIAALIPNQGQSDYAAANSFLDRFALMRKGLTLSINWPLWKSGGMQVEPEQEKDLKTVFGMDPLPTKVGIKVFEHLLNSATGQVIVISGDKSKIMRAFEGETKVEPEKVPDKNITQFLKETIASVLKIQPDDLDLDTNFENYGINSIVITEINSLLEKRYKGLPKTLFFEYSNLKELIKYFDNLAPTVSSEVPEFVELASDKKFTLIDSFEKSVFYKTFRPNQPYVKGFSHKGKAAVPGACFLEMGRQCGAKYYSDKNFVTIFNNYWPVPLEIEGEEVTTQTKLSLAPEGVNFEISSNSVVHATGTLGMVHRFPKPPQIDLNNKIASAKRSLKTKAFYDTIHANADLRLSGLFRPVQDFYLLENEAIARLDFPDLEKEAFVIQPVLFTGLEQSLLVYTALTHAAFHPQGMRLMPFSIEAVDIYAPFPQKVYLHLSAKSPPSENNKIQRFDATLYNEQGEVVAFVSGNTMRISPKEITAEDNDIAIIGMSGRFPDAGNVVEFWNNLMAGKDSVTERPLHQDLYSSQLADQEGVLLCKYGASIKSVDSFDPEFFGIAPIEGALIDPQERLFLQVAWEALQDAGWDPKNMTVEARKLGVFVGVIWQDYQLIALEETLKGDPVVASSLLYSIANRVSYTFNFTGPSLSVDTACSSSLTALHLACQSIWLGEIHSAIVGGVNLNLHPMKYAFLNNYSFLSSEGKCRSYGEGGDGYVPGEGVGALVIKSLKEAIKDGDPIYAVIKASAINHGGKTRGYTVPNPLLQSEVILTALERGKVNPREISYVEGHGTGTALGDPVEIRGLDLAYSKFTPDKQYCAIGSVKSNIGHLEAAAGVASIIKVILQMQYGILVPSLHSETLNKNIDFSNTPFFVQRKIAPWKSEGPFMAAISSFGAGGSYAHVILQKYGENREIQKPEILAALKSYWIESKSHPLLGKQLELSKLPYLKDHQVYQNIIFPGAAYIEMILAAVGQNSLHLEGVSFEVVLELSRAVETRIVLNSNLVTIQALNANGTWVDHAKGTFRPLEPVHEKMDYKNECKESLSKEDFYRYVHSCGLNLGEKFQTLQNIWLGENSAFGEVILSSSAKEYFAHPALLDGCLQLLYALLWKEKRTGLYLPMGFDSIDFYAPLGNHVFAYFQMDDMTAHLKIWSPTGDLLASINGFHFRKATEESLKHALVHQEDVGDIFYQWNWEEKIPENSIEIKGNWLVLGDGTVSDQVRTFLESKGAVCHSTGDFSQFQGIVHTPSKNPTPESGPKSLLELVQALIKLEAKIPLFVLTENNFIQSPMNGLIKTILLEHPELNLKQIILEENWNPELLFKNESIYRIDDKKYYVPRLIQKKVHSELPKIKKDATYLITGGLGGLGQTLTQWLIDKGAKKIVLVGRAPLNIKLRKEVSYEAIDISDEKSVSELLSRLSSLKGIFHLAGVLDDHTLMEQKWENFEKVFAAKVYGSLYLHQYSKDLDYFVMFSSIASMLGNPGQSNYAAANAFLDGLCTYRKTKGLPGLSISWGPWAEVGMAKDLVSRGLIGLNPAEGMHALEQVLSSNLSHVLIAKIDWENYIKKLPRLPSYLKDFGKEKIEKNLFILTKDERIEVIKQALQSILGTTSNIDVNKDFSNMGLDSLMAIDLKNYLQKLIGETPVLAASAVFDYSTVKKLSDYLDSLMSSEKITTEEKFNSPKDLLKFVKLVEIPKLPDRISDFPPKKILITGASGFLGVFLLKSLSEQFKGASFYCLARAKDDAEAKMRIINNLKNYKIPYKNFENRIFAIASDLQLPQFGLEDSKYGVLAEEIDVIVNSAAYLNWAFSYYALAPHNVTSVQELIKFATTTKLKDFHHMSSIAVFPRDMSKLHQISEDQDLVYEGDLSNNGLSKGYFQTKWVAEMLAIEARKKGVKINIYRPVSLVSDTKYGVPSPDEFCYRISEGCRQLKLAPENDTLLDILPVDTAANIITKIISKGHPKNEIFNIVNLNPLPIRKLFIGLQEAGEDVQIVDRETWDKALAKITPDNPLAPVISVVPNYLSLCPPNFSCKNTLAALGEERDLLSIDHSEIVRSFVRGQLEHEKK